MLKIQNTRLLEINVTAAPAVGDVYFFPNDNEIDLKFVDAIETYDNTILFSSPEGNPIVTLAGGAEVVLFLYQDSMARFYSVPYNSFNTVQNAGILRQLDNFKINLQKSYMQIVSVGTIANGDSIAISFMYNRAVI